MLYWIGYLYVFFDKLVGVYKVRPTSQQTCRFKLTFSCKYISRQMVAQIWAFYHLTERLCVYKRLVGGQRELFDLSLRHIASTICYRYHFWTIRCCCIFHVQNNVAKWMLLYATLYPFKIGMNRHFLASSTYDMLSCCLATFTLPKGLSHFQQLQTIYLCCCLLLHTTLSFTSVFLDDDAAQPYGQQSIQCQNVG